MSNNDNPNSNDLDSPSDDFTLENIFPEPPRSPSPEPNVVTYTRPKRSSDDDKQREIIEEENEAGWSEIVIRLVASHPLWAHHLWNSARSFATYLHRNVDLYRGKNVLELGAGGGLPGMVTVLNGARKTVLSDYPDKALLDNLSHNVESNIPPHLGNAVVVQGYVWGTPADKLLELAPEGYDLIILSDLVFNYSEHDALIKSCELTLRKTDPSNPSSTPPPTVLVFYSHHRPHLAHRDLELFSKAQARRWTCKEVVTERYPPMFPDDPGDEEVRGTVHGWALTL